MGGADTNFMANMWQPNVVNFFMTEANKDISIVLHGNFMLTEEI